MKHFWILLFAALCSYANAKVVNVVDFGAKPDSRVDCTSAVANAVKALVDGDVLAFPRGRYDFFTDNAATHNYYESNTTDVFPKRLAIWLRGLNDITIEGNNSSWIMHDQIQPLTIDSCTNIVVKNITVDWDNPLTAQGYVCKVTDDGFEVTIDDAQFPFDVVDEKIIFKGKGWSSGIIAVMEFENRVGHNPRIVPSTGDVTSWQVASYKVSRLSGNKVFFHKPAPDSYSPKVGNAVVMRHNERAHAGIFVIGSDRVRFDDVIIHHTGGLGILCQYSSNLTFENSSVVPNFAKGRYFSSHDDGFHIMGCRGDIKIEGCQWGGLMDDAINVHGTALRIVKIDGKKLLCRFMHHQSVGMEWGQIGNEVGFLNHNTLATLGTTKIASIKHLSATDVEIVTENKPPKSLKEGDALENLYWTPSSVIIKNNIFDNSRARGMLVSVPSKVIIDGNTFDSSGAAILIAGDANGWYETGAVRDVTISNNVFNDCNTSYYQFCGAIISIDPEIPTIDPAKPFHSNITIKNNTFNTSNKAVVYAKSVRGLRFIDNKVVRDNGVVGVAHEQQQEVTLVGCVDCDDKL